MCKHKYLTRILKKSLTSYEAEDYEENGNCYSSKQKILNAQDKFSWRAYFEGLQKKYSYELKDSGDFEHQNVEFQITGAEDGEAISEKKMVDHNTCWNNSLAVKIWW